MKNVTITVEEPVLEWVRVEAAKRNSSMSRLVGEMLAEKMQHENTYERAKHEALRFQSWGVSEGPYLTRDDMYERSRFR